jgi:hypothetical protein
MTWRRVLFLTIVLVPMGVVVACSDPETRPPPAVQGNTAPPPTGGGSGAETGTLVDGASLDGGEAGVCNDVVVTGGPVDRVAINLDPPVSTGGTIVDGTYDLTDYTVYVGISGVGGPTGITAQATIRIGGATIDEHLQIGGATQAVTDTTTSSQFSVTGATFAETQLCPNAGAAEALQFTFNDPILVLTDPINKEAFTYTKR